MQNKVLIVDGDTRSLRLLEVSLKQAGYRVVTATSGVDALGQLEVEIPDLVLADTAIGEVDGFALYQRLQQRPEWAYLPFILILDEDNPAEKLRAVQLGVTDFLTRPLFLKEALSRVELLLEKQAQRGERGSGQAPTSGRARFAGVLSGTALLDLFQTMELGHKSGIAYCVSGRGQRAAIYFTGGVAVDAELGRLHGTEALYRILTFQGGEYRVELLPVSRTPRIEIGGPGLIMEAMRYLEEWNRHCAALPPLTAPLAPLGGTAGALRPESLPSELRDMLRLFDGRRSVFDVLEILDEQAPPPHDALGRLAMVAKLYAARLLAPAGRPASGEPRAAVPTPLAVPRLTPSPNLTPPLLPRLTPPPLPRLTPPPLPRLTPPPLAGGRAAVLAGLGRPTPVALPRAVVKTPVPIGDSGTLVLPEELLVTLVPGMPPQSAEARSLRRTTDAGSSDESLTPLPPPFPPTARPTPPPLPSLRGPSLTPPMAKQAAEPAMPPSGSAWMTPLPVPELRELRPTPVMGVEAVLPELPLPVEPGSARLTPPPLPGKRAQRPTPVMAMEAVRLEMATNAEPSAARLTPPPLPEMRALRPTPVMAMEPARATMSLPAEPFVRELRSAPALAVEVVSPISEDALEWVTSAALGETSEVETPRPPAPTPVVVPALRADAEEEAAAAPGSTSPEAWMAPVAAPARMGELGISSPGHNLARLAQRLAATRQPLPFVAPQLPSLTVVASAAPVGAEPAAGGLPLSTAGEPGAVVAAAGQSWVGSLPELEPISIPEFELMIEHSAPSWAQSAPPQSAAPSSEQRTNQTLPVHLRPQNRAAAAELDQAVHISAPVSVHVPAVAEAASISLPPIEIETPPPQLLLPKPPPPARSPLRWGRAVAWVVAAMALFSLGVGLYWVRQELDRGISVTAPSPAPRAQATAAPSGVAPAATPPKSAESPAPEPALSAPVVAAAPPLPAPAASGQQSRSAEHTSAAVPESARAAAAPDPGPSQPAAAAPPHSVASAAPAPASAVSPPPSGEFAALIAKARTFEHRGALTPAYHAVRGAQRLQPRSAEVFAILAQLSLDEGNADKAAGLAKRALSLNKSSADAYLVLGTVEQARSHPAKARVYFKKYLELAPTGDRAVEVRAVLRLSQH